MNEKTEEYKKRLADLYEKMRIHKSGQEDKIYIWEAEKEKKYHTMQDILDKRRAERTVSINIKDVLGKFTPEQLIDAIGVEKVEAILRSRKLVKIQNKLKKK
jgi:hypothetical protein